MQTKYALVLAAVVMFVGCNKGDGGAKVADSTAIQGKWSIVEVEDSGRKPSAEQIAGSTIEFTADKMTLHQTGKEKPQVSDYKIDEAKKHFDLKSDNKEHWSPGIYELKGDELRICLNEQNGATDRSTEFKSEKTGANDLLFVLRRAK